MCGFLSIVAGSPIQSVQSFSLDLRSRVSAMAERATGTGRLVAFADEKSGRSNAPKGRMKGNLRVLLPEKARQVNGSPGRHRFGELC